MWVRLADPAQLAQVHDWVENGGDAFSHQSKIFLIGWENVLLSAVGAEALKAFEGHDMRSAADALGVDPFDLMLRLIDEDGGQTGVILFQLDEDDLHAACCNRLHMAGSDGLPRLGSKPHPRAFGTFPRIAGPLRREKSWFSIEDAVRRMTSVAAQRFQLHDRGLNRPGLAADLVLFEDAITDNATFSSPTELRSGILSLWGNGRAVIVNRV